MEVHQNKILTKQKKAIICLIRGLKHIETAKQLYAVLNIFTVYSLYILESVEYVREHCSNGFFERRHPYNHCSPFILDQHSPVKKNQHKVAIFSKF